MLLVSVASAENPARSTPVCSAEALPATNVLTPSIMFARHALEKIKNDPTEYIQTLAIKRKKTPIETFKIQHIIIYLLTNYYEREKTKRKKNT